MTAVPLPDPAVVLLAGSASGQLVNHQWQY